MSIASLDLQRARRALDAFCATRNAGAPAGGGRLRCEQHGQEFVLSEIGVAGAKPGPEVSRPLVRLVLSEGSWHLYWRTGSDAWGAWPHLPRTDKLQRIIDELEQAPLHVHWR